MSVTTTNHPVTSYTPLQPPTKTADTHIRRKNGRHHHHHHTSPPPQPDTSPTQINPPPQNHSTTSALSKADLGRKQSSWIHGVYKGTQGQRQDERVTRDRETRFAEKQDLKGKKLKTGEEDKKELNIRKGGGRWCGDEVSSHHHFRNTT